MFNALSSRSALLITISLSQSLPRRVPPKYICKRKIIGLTESPIFLDEAHTYPYRSFVVFKYRTTFYWKRTSKNFLVCPISELIWVALSNELFSVFEKHKILQHLPVIRTNYWCHTLFDTHRKRSCQVRLTSSPALYFRHAQKTHMLRKIDRKSRTLLGTHIKRS